MSGTGTCNNNGFCDAGENLANCFNDCLSSDSNKVQNADTYAQLSGNATLVPGEKLKAGQRLTASCDVYLELKVCIGHPRGLA